MTIQKVSTNELANTGVTAGTYGSSANSVTITVGADGRVTSVANAAISAPLPNILMLSGM